MMGKKMQRRDFIKNLGKGAGLFVFMQTLGVNAFAQRRKRGSDKAGSGEAQMVDATKGMARSVNYVEKHSDLKNDSLKVTKQGVEFKDQFCHNCVLYKKQGEKDGKEVGVCTLFPRQLVYGDAWCTSWAKKS